MSFTLCILILLISPFLHNCLLPLTAPLQIKQSLREKKGGKLENNLIMEPAVWHRESRSKPFRLYIFTCKCSSQRVIGLVQGLWFLLHHQCWALIRTFVSLCYGDPAALGLPVRSLHILQQIVDRMDVGAGQVITLGLGLSSCRVGLQASSPLSSPPGWVLQHCPG